MPVRVLYLGRGLTKAMLLGPARWRSDTGCPPIGRRRLRRVGAAARRPLRRASRRAGHRRKDRRDVAGRHGSLAAILAAAEDPKSAMPKALRAKLRQAADYIEAADPVVRVATDAPVELSTSTDAVPLVAADPRRTAELASRLGVGSPVARLQKALDSLPG
ncbi:putative 5'-3' exonuclease [Mycobacterium xenopi 3993]|nr:putative 5'-3' exonuclease [Mycobacterium xenopi 3993]